MELPKSIQIPRVSLLLVSTKFKKRRNSFGKKRHTEGVIKKHANSRDVFDRKFKSIVTPWERSVTPLTANPGYEILKRLYSL